MNQDTLPTSSPDAIAVAIRETLLWLCSIASPIGEEKELCDAVVHRLSRLRLSGPIRRYGDSCVVPLLRRTDLKRPHIVLAGHLDTVRTENGPARVADGRCYGAGAADMKSGLAVMVLLAETLGSQCEADISLVFYAREEGPFAENELGPVLAEDRDIHSADLAVCLEPSDNRLHLGCCGSIHATVTFHGKTGHSARPWEGDNAITKAGALLSRLASVTPKEHTIDGLVYRTTTTVTLAQGGRGRNIVPDAFTLNVNHRFAPTTSLQQAQADVRALIGEGPELAFTDLSPAAMPNASHPLVRALIAAGVRGIEPKQAWTDVARFAQAGIAAVNFGPGENAQAHQRNESTSLALVVDGYNTFRDWLLSIRV